MKWNELTVTRRVELLQWALPVSIILLVIVYQTFFVEYVHDLLGEEGHYLVEVTFYGAIGPLVTFFVLAWISRWLREREEMEKQVREQGKRLTLIRIEEGKRVAQHLHREVLPNLAYVHTKMDLTQGQLQDLKYEPKQAAGEIVKIMTTLRETIGELREKINTLREGTPFKSLPEGANLIDELNKRSDEFKELLQLDVRINCTGLNRALPHNIASIVWRVIGEALNNIALHAQAKSASIELSFSRENTVELALSDDGIGFDVATKLANPTGLGLIHMSNEVEQLNGQFSIVSRPGKGTKIVACFPFEPENGNP